MIRRMTAQASGLYLLALILLSSVFQVNAGVVYHDSDLTADETWSAAEIGRASCRERV